MAITKFKPEGIKTLDVKWNNGIVRVSHDAQLAAVESRGVVTFLVYEPELDEEHVLAEIELDVKPSKMDESQKALFFWILDEYDEGVEITRANQLEEAFKKVTGDLRKIGVIE